MPDEVRRVEYYYVTVPDRPGAGLKVLSQLKEAGVNLGAYLGFPGPRGKSQIDLFPEDAASLKQALEKTGLRLVGPRKAFLIQGDDRAGAVADILRPLAEAKINVKAAAAAAAGGGRYGMILWVAQASYEKAAKALGA
jgi:hypothetical protein